MKRSMRVHSAVDIAQINRFKRVVIQTAKLPTFIHHEWFIKYHLRLVECISLESCALYPRADRNLVLLLVWFHDYGKIIDIHHEHEATYAAGKEKLLELGFPLALVRKVVQYSTIFDNKTSIKQAPIEVQIVSSADGAAHLIGPFYALYWKEHNNQPYKNLMEENKRKGLVDWNQKIVLPEVKKAFLSRHKLLLEHCGVFPKAFLS